ncbi:hypothetical protein CYMTET_14464 [Cymbomonas tetramitiformis]|uniref:Uncharacterized protein n=1 Tax=Cymbomonas tetramitiformis TaxID=36881 RepID=A0AAE0GHH3_9CHLO|nr:hypothetical protein CYMTET_14464 [Cymbomonas tetramitiformis]
MFTAHEKLTKTRAFNKQDPDTEYEVFMPLQAYEQSAINGCFKFFKKNFTSSDANRLSFQDFRNILRTGTYNYGVRKLSKLEEREYVEETSCGGSTLVKKKFGCKVSKVEPGRVSGDDMPPPTGETQKDHRPAEMQSVDESVESEQDKENVPPVNPGEAYLAECVAQRQKVREELAQRLAVMRSLGVPSELVGASTSTPVCTSKGLTGAAVNIEGPQPIPVVQRASSEKAKEKARVPRKQVGTPGEAEDFTKFPEPKASKFSVSSLPKYRHLFEQEDMKSAIDKLSNAVICGSQLQVDCDLVGKVCQEGFNRPRRWFLGLVIGYRNSKVAAEGKVYTIVFQDAEDCAVKESACRVMLGLPKSQPARSAKEAARGKYEHLFNRDSSDDESEDGDGNADANKA